MPRLAALLLLLPLAAPAAEVPGSWTRAWPETDFSTLRVDPGEIVSGGVPRDGIPAISGPRMRAAAEETALDPREPVMALDPDGAPARAYPLRYLTWHEIVNDTVAGRPIAVTFCPLCNSGLIFDRGVGGRTLEFGVSGMLRHSDLIMFDRQTESWWQQFTGRAIAGELAGERLEALPATLEGWAQFRDAHPDGLVMAEPEGHVRDYGENPYTGYDTARPFLYRGEDPPHGIDPVARVLRVGERAWPLSRLRAAGRIEEAGLVIDWREGQASALDTRRIAEGREVGSIRVTDAETGEAVVHEVVFAFAFHAFEPEGEWMLGE
jgi:hypothetical protein